MKKILFLLTFAAGISATAQVKVGNNVTTLATNANFQVEGTTTTDQFVVLKDGSVGIGTKTPTTKLEIAGQIKITGGTPGVGKVLTSDAVGLATWAAISGSGTVTSVTGTAPISVATGTSTPAISIATANTTTTGALSSTDWNTFNNKQAAITATAPITLTGSAVGIASASTTASGALSSTDWNIFNNKIGTANNGLTVSAGNVKLGGALIENTSLTGNFNFTLPGTGAVGIGTTTPTQKLHVVGGALVSSLAGTGSRMVVADATGVLSSQAVPEASVITAGTNITVTGSGTVATPYVVSQTPLPVTVPTTNDYTVLPTDAVIYRQLTATGTITFPASLPAGKVFYIANTSGSFNWVLSPAPLNAGTTQMYANISLTVVTVGGGNIIVTSGY
jgi:hypothetical protein